MSNDTKIRPALDADEWEEFRRTGQFIRDEKGQYLRVHSKGLGFLGYQRLSVEGAHHMAEETHALAALALYGQSFGFTQGDVAALRACIDPVLNCEDAGWHTVEHRERLAAIADRIAALLPPN